MDTQITELLGRSRLISELLHAGLEVAVPARDRGIDLIAYVDLRADTRRFIARPIQMKAATTEQFAIAKKYAKVSDLILAYVWHLEDPATAVTYAMTYPEAVEIGTRMGWTKTSSWIDKHAYSTTKPSKKLKKLLEPYVMTPERWRERIVGTPRVR